MIARKIKLEEVKRTEELFSISFDSSYDNDAPPMELYQKYTENPTSREEEHCLLRFAAFEDDDATMMSCFILQPFEIRFDGHNESMYGVGGVATLPQYRRKGGIRACFQKALPYLYEKGAVFSYLYPFSTSYYRKFGYELCSKRLFYTVALEYIPSFEAGGSCYMLEKSTETLAMEDIPYIYRAWQEKYNTMVLDTPYDFNFIKNANPFKDQVFTYVYRSAKGEPLGYMTFQNKRMDEPRKIECSRFFYVNEEGLKGLLSLAKSFASDYRQICFNLPADSCLEHLLPEWALGAVSCQLCQEGIIRIINAQKVLQDAAYKGSGSCILKIEDAFIEENSRTFQIVFEDGRCKKAALTDRVPDAVLSISAFSALLMGGYYPDDIVQFPGVQINGNMESLKKVFYKKPVYITSYF